MQLRENTNALSEMFSFPLFCIVEVKGSLRNPTVAANKEAGNLGVKQKCR